MDSMLWFSLLTLFSSLLAILTPSLAIGSDKKVYIVYMGAKPENELLAVNQHTSVLQDVLQNSLVQDSVVYRYRKSFNGFAAKLTEEESRKIAGMEGVISVFPNRMYKLHTTRSWDFLGLHESIKRVHQVENNIIVGVLDTGVWPESKSFKDHGVGPPPKKWRGACETQNFTCNNKIIGARVYPHTDSTSVRDEVGHGSHTTSTIAGRSVHGASLYGLAKGNARGGVPSAKIAVYKVCSFKGCSSLDILAAFDDAIADGVDIISLSLGPDSATHFFQDPIAIGSFHAMAQGILTSNSAGNSGPSLGSVTSVAPWILTVAATSIDRNIITKIALGNGKNLVGNAINTFSSNGTKFPLISGVDARASGCDSESARTCADGCLDPRLVKGKILLCEGADDHGTSSLEAGALGVVTQSRYEDVGFVYPLPTSSLTLDQLLKVSSYVNKTRNPRAKIMKSKSVLTKEAPAVATFSSRGPNGITPQILKPDISAPGVDILAAWSPVAGLTRLPDDKRSVNYHIISGTSMACPHATAAAAYVKSFHPDWSPSVIKSALMTTATSISRKSHYDAEFAYGSGNIDPVKATNPGLVFDSSKKDYVHLLCSIGYTTKQVRSISGDTSNCQGKGREFVNNLNYPSVAYKVKSDSDFFNVTFSRTVTNVGKAKSVYISRILPLKSWNIKVRTVPRVLKFTELNERKNFKVVISGRHLEKQSIFSHSIQWTDGKHVVRIPVVVYSL